MTRSGPARSASERREAPSAPCRAAGKGSSAVDDPVVDKADAVHLQSDGDQSAPCNLVDINKRIGIDHGDIVHLYIRLMRLEKRDEPVPQHRPLMRRLLERGGV